MKHPAYFLAIDSFPRTITLKEIGQRILSAKRKTVGSVQVAELCSMADYPNGLYFFFNPSGGLCYVGKSTSRSFIERVPSHFDQRENTWFNTLPRKIMKLGEAADYASALEAALAKEIVLLGVKSKEIATKLEADLRSHLQPSLNARHTQVRETKRLSEYAI